MCTSVQLCEWSLSGWWRRLLLGRREGEELQRPIVGRRGATATRWAMAIRGEGSEEVRWCVGLSEPLRHRQVVGMQREEIEAIADRVAELLKVEEGTAGQQDGRPVLVDAATLARILGVSRATVYANADELGAIRLGSGRRARLRFDPRRWLSVPGSTDPGAGSDHPSSRAAPSREERHPSTRLLPIRPTARRNPRRRVA